MNKEPLFFAGPFILAYLSSMFKTKTLHFKRIVRMCWECLTRAPVHEIFISYLQQSFGRIPREVGDIES